jgi:hypothetical protein
MVGSLVIAKKENRKVRETMAVMGAYTVPGMKSDTAERVIKLLQDRLNSLNDLALTLKHVHWNVTGS